MDASQLANANQAMAQNTAAIAGGIGSVLGGLAGGFGVDGKFDLANMTKMIQR